jgi:hypothetical protein
MPRITIVLENNLVIVELKMARDGMDWEKRDYLRITGRER